MQLLERLHDVSDEVRQIQHKVVHIAELQSIFTEKVMEQVRVLAEGCVRVECGGSCTSLSPLPGWQH